MSKLGCLAVCGLFLVVASGCADPGARLVGKWQGKMKVELPASDNPQAALMPQAFLQPMLDKMTLDLEFTKDHKMSVSGGEALGGRMPIGSQGTWQVARSDGNTLYLKMNNGQSDKEMKVTFEGDDTFRMGQGDNPMPFVFTRVKP